MIRLLCYLLLLALSLFFSCSKPTAQYVCTPCDLPCDEKVFTKGGFCPDCKMELLKKSNITTKEELVLNEIDIKNGSGTFKIDGGASNKHKTVEVFYHKPKNFQTASKVLLVIPGAGRNADSYRNAWIETSEKYSVIILSLKYLEKEFNFGDYHLCGLLKNLNLEENVEFVQNTNIVKLNEDNLEFNINTNASGWIFNDFDRIFNLVKSELSLKAENYDIFGHSAGGHILHRFAIFSKTSKANNIIAANPSFYTLTSFEYQFPFGLKDAPINHETLKSSFAKNLVVFLGEKDNQNEMKGSFLRSKSADKQGLHRLERGKFFYKTAKEKAKSLATDFNWELKIIPNTGHNQKAMSKAAANYLYNTKK